MKHFSCLFYIYNVGQPLYIKDFQTRAKKHLARYISIYQILLLLTAELAKAKVVTGIAIGTAADIDENGGGGGGGYDAKWAGSLRG